MNLKEAKEKYIQLGEAIENLQQNTERHNLKLIHSALGQLLINELDDEWSKAESSSQNYDETFGDDKLCSCGHPYYRHFDSYDDNRNVGCKYCGCYNWEPMDPARAANIMDFSDLKPFDIFKLTHDPLSHDSHLPHFIKISNITVFDKIVNCIEVDPKNMQSYIEFPDIKVEKIGVYDKKEILDK